MLAWLLKVPATLFGLITSGGAIWDTFRNRGEGANALQKHVNAIQDGEESVGEFLNRAIKSTKQLLKDDGPLEERLKKAVKYGGPYQMSDTFKEEAQKLADRAIAAKEAAGETITESAKKMALEKAMETLSGKSEFKNAAANEEGGGIVNTVKKALNMGVPGIIGLFANWKFGGSWATALPVAIAFSTAWNMYLKDKVMGMSREYLGLFNDAAEGPKDKKQEYALAFTGLDDLTLENG